MADQVKALHEQLTAKDAEIERLRKVVGAYADESNWTSDPEEGPLGWTSIIDGQPRYTEEHVRKAMLACDPSSTEADIEYEIGRMFDTSRTLYRNVAQAIADNERETREADLKMIHSFIEREEAALAVPDISMLRKTMHGLRVALFEEIRDAIRSLSTDKPEPAKGIWENKL